MDSFENLMATLLEFQGYWTKTNFKVELTRQEKERIGRPTCPRWELDVIAYKPCENELLIVECKSYMYSNGVTCNGVAGKNQRDRGRYKLFNESGLLTVIKQALNRQLQLNGLKPRIKLCLAAGNIRNGDRESILRYFNRRRHWLLFDKEWIVEALNKYAKLGYNNETASVVMKLINPDTTQKKWKKIKKTKKK